MDFMYKLRMIFKLTAKGCQIPPKTRKHINKHLEKFARSLQNIQNDLVVFRLLIKKNIDRYHPLRMHPHPHKSYADIKPALAYYEGLMTFRLDKKQLYVHFKGQTVDESIDRGFDLLFKKLEKYKNLRFSSESEYPDRSSIRQRFL